MTDIELDTMNRANNKLDNNNEEINDKENNASINLEILKQIISNSSGISIKMNQRINNSKIVNDESYEEMWNSKYDYFVYFKEIPGKESNENNEYTFQNDTNFLNKNFFIGPSKGLKYSLFKMGDEPDGKNTGITFEKERDNFLSFSNNKSIYCKNNGIIFGEIKVDNGWIYDTYSIYSKKEKGNSNFSVRINKYTWAYNFRNTIFCNIKGLEFPIYNKDGIIVGKIKKENPSNPSYFCKGWSNVDYFTVDFPGDASEEEKIMMMGLAISIDDMHISDIKTFN